MINIKLDHKNITIDKGEWENLLTMGPPSENIELTNLITYARNTITNDGAFIISHPDDGVFLRCDRMSEFNEFIDDAV